MDANKPLAARAQFAKALGQSPEHADALLGMAQALLLLDQVQASIRYSEQALGIAPDRAEGYLMLAGASLAQGRSEKALEWIDQALALAPEAAELHYVRGRALGAMHRWREAVAAAEQGLTLDPAHGGCAGLLASVQAILKESDERSGDALRQALADNPEDERALASAALDALLRGDLERAIQLNRLALDQDPSVEWVYQNLLYCLRATLPGYSPILRYVAFLVRHPTARSLLSIATPLLGAAGLYLWERSGWGAVLVATCGAFVFFGSTADSVYNAVLLRGERGRLIKRPYRVQAITVSGSLVFAVVWSACLVVLRGADEVAAYLPLSVPFAVEPAAIRRGVSAVLAWVLAGVGIALVGFALRWPVLEVPGIALCLGNRYLLYVLELLQDLATAVYRVLSQPVEGPPS